MPAVSAVLITHNSGRTLADTLAALGWCDEIVVVDSGSDDRTLDICRQFGCRVLHHDFAGFGRQKNFAVAAARHDWVLVVDSDEIVTPELRQEIRERLAHDAERFAGFEIPISLVFLGRLLRFGGERDKRHLRLFDRRSGKFSLDEIHERATVDGPVGALRGRMLHASYRDVEHYFEKFNRYTSAAARQLKRDGVRPARWLVGWRFPAVFAHRYLWQGLIFDGYPGFVWALFSALHATVKYVKLLELETPAHEDSP